MNVIETLLGENVAAIVMAGGFIYYLILKDKSTKKTYEEFNKSLRAFNKTLNSHLGRELSASNDLAKSLQLLTDTVRDLIECEKKLNSNR